jgi:hypothetical protein
MAAQPTASLAPALDPGGLERAIARRVPALMVGAVGVLLILWWMAAQPPPGPGWGNPNDPNAPRPGPDWQQPWQGQPAPPQPPPPAPSAGCSACVGLDCADCLSGIDCVDCIDCADCLSGLDCTCAVSGGSSTSSAAGVSAPVTMRAGRSCTTSPWKRLAGSSGLLLPLFVMIGWRRRLRR